MTILFFKVENVLNFEGTEAAAPSGRRGAADKNIKNLRDKLNSMPVGTQLVLYGEWTKDWDFNDSKCTPDGKYLIKKLDRKGLHIMDKTDDIDSYLQKKHIDSYEVL